VIDCLSAIGAGVDDDPVGGKKALAARIEAHPHRARVDEAPLAEHEIDRRHALQAALAAAPELLDHALLALGAMHVGVPVAPISPAYSLLSRDFVKLKTIFALLRPGLVYASDGKRFAAALGALPSAKHPALPEVKCQSHAGAAF